MIVLVAKAGRYLALAALTLGLLAFSLLSELPYRLLSPESATLNVMPTLSLGLLLAWGIHHADRNSLFLAATALVVALLLHRQLMYGVIGVTLPAACVLGLKGVRWWLLPAALAVLANSRNRWFVEWGIVPETLAMFAMAGAAVLLGVALLRQPMSCTVWPVGRWGYWFYPGHLAAIYLMKL
ncbi:TPA: conjugal transfer protein TraX [Pseudomonas aeruginosa]|uniref:Conjugal transfer protein TraX n=2 Tax=Pseudomonadaceae TaxID=135621 RepID=A0A9X1N8I2_9GAMM|nr:TraX family protein [Stutzerimonas nitrititolerans]MCD1610607.1 conjugal transfer protein TraX [Stutzerimonas kunmingensis]PNF98746.1 conjugal transfer protein TraX [Stutzerimonas kunmingensis]HBN9752154.1 conjugal transfer protein TraX [Pseudomonas aeruginosa]